jgi:hypothetical protein
MDNLNLPNKVYSSLEGNKGNLYANFSQAKRIFFQPHLQDYFLIRTLPNI